MFLKNYEISFWGGVDGKELKGTYREGKNFLLICLGYGFQLVVRVPIGVRQLLPNGAQEKILQKNIFLLKKSCMYDFSFWPRRSLHACMHAYTSDSHFGVTLRALQI